MFDLDMMLHMCGRPYKKNEFAECPRRVRDITDNPKILSQLKDLTPCQLGSAVTLLSTLFGSWGYQQIVLNPFTSYPIDYKGEVIDIPGVGQLRYNTEPEIWENCNSSDRFFSTSTLFRKETKFNALRRPAFLIIDFYQRGRPDSLLVIFKRVLNALANAGLIANLHKLQYEQASYDTTTGGPSLSILTPRWVVTTGYDAAHSFFETDLDGCSTRSELFLITPFGFLEIAALGIVGWNRNPDYVFRAGAENVPPPNQTLSGMGFGLERLLLADQILPLLERIPRNED